MLCLSVLLLDVLLLTAATQDSEEQQKEHIERYFLRVDGEGPPENVTVIGASTTSLLVSWDPPPATPQYYEVDIFSEDISEVVYDTSYVVENLQVCTSYIVTVTSYYRDNQYTGPITQGTTQSSVPPPPQNCKISEPVKGKVQVQWKDPEFECSVTNHSIVWTWDVLWSDEERSVETFTTSNQYTLSDVTPDSDVTVHISSGNDGGFSTSLNCSLVTSEDKPGAPVIVNTASYEAGSATVTWTPPVDANGIILNYKITSKSEEGLERVVNGTELTTVFEDLHQCESYSFSVAARTTVGYGPDSEDSSVSISGNITLKEAICSVEESNAKMCWSANYPQCQVSYYNVTWNGTVKWSDQSVTGSGIYLWAGATENCYVVNDSVPFTDYTLCVEVEDLTSETFCCSSDTPESVPGPPVLLNLEVIQTSITVSWSDPVDKNGIINGYLVTWTSNNGDTGNQSVGLSTSSYEIPDLVACETYSVTVQASTSAGWGDGAPPEKVTIANYIPESGLNCVNVETRQVEVSWILVSPECSVSEFSLAWNTSVLWSSSSSSNSTLLDGDVYSTVLADLQPYTEVSACLSIPDDGRGGVCCTCITGEEVPGPPVLENLEIIQASITVSWSDPVDKNGIINGYLVTWTSNSGDTESQSVGSDSKTYVIPDLVACETYSVTVQASTSAGWGDGAPPEKVTIANYIPESGMTCTNETRRVEISWSLASLECPGTTFFLGWETKVLWSTSTSSNGTLLDGDVTSAVISDLQPYTEVTACLSIPDDPRGKVCCTCITDEEVPGPPENVRVNEL